MQRDQLTQYLDNLLEPELFKDYCPNGLQVEGKSEITKLVTGVTGCIDLFKKAITAAADGILVHHGIIWNFERPVYRGSYKDRVKLLLENDLNLWGYHLPIDAHKTYGNNAVLADFFALKNREEFGDLNGSMIGVKGMTEAEDPDFYFEKIKTKLNSDAVILPYGPKKIKTIGIISGGAQKEFKQAISGDIDLYITGEISEYNMHMAKEEGIHFVSAGHHATERFGVRKIGELIQKKFNIDVEFIDIPNPA